MHHDGWSRGRRESVVAESAGAETTGVTGHRSGCARQLFATAQSAANHPSRLCGPPRSPR